MTSPRLIHAPYSTPPVTVMAVRTTNATGGASNHIQALENRLGVRLLNRTTRKVSLTDVGRAYYERCVDILHHLEDADRAAGAMQATPRGTLRLYTGLHIVQFVAPVITETELLTQTIEPSGRT